MREENVSSPSRLSIAEIRARQARRRELREIAYGVPVGCREPGSIDASRRRMYAGEEYQVITLLHADEEIDFLLDALERATS
jgi:hypothetical protein